MGAKKAARRTRVVGTVVDHGAPITFETLASRVITPRTRYLVLDLDRTVHLGRNLGELLGFELIAALSYGEAALEGFESRRRGRWMLDWSRPFVCARYLAMGATVWAYPGLYYLLWGKIASRIPWLRRKAFLRFGPQPVPHVQRVPQVALLSQLDGQAPEVLDRLAARLWRRYAKDQVIDRADLEAVRRIAPDIEIVLSSASPRPTVQTAAKELGVDLVGYSTLDRINGGEAKIAHLRALRPDIDEVEVVGITDTGYGEDHCWAQAFTRVVDINSTSPFPVLVDASSPLEEVHSARVLTKTEMARRAAGEEAWLDPRRIGGRWGAPRRVAAEQVAARLHEVADEIERISAQGIGALKGDVAYSLTCLHERARSIVDEMLATLHDEAGPVVGRREAR